MIRTHTMPTGDIREIKGKVEYYINGVAASADNYNDRLVSIDITRQGTTKFFGYGVSHKLSYKRYDKISIADNTTIKVSFGDGTTEGWVSAFPSFHPDTITYDETANETTVTAYDGLYYASKHAVSELEHNVNMASTITILVDCAKLLKCNTDGFVVQGLDNTERNNFANYTYTGNFGDNQTLRELLDAIAEYWGMIYYIDCNNDLTFKRLNKNGASLYSVPKSQYFTLSNSGNKVLQSVCKVNDLGDNVIASLGADGETQYIRNNMYLEDSTEIAEQLENILSYVGGLTINQVNCKWRGNYLLEIGDKISFDGYTTYLLNDSISYAGGFSQVTQWEFDSEESAAANPITIGEAIKNTYAKVDKANQTIELLTSKTDANQEAISLLQMNTDGINASVTKLQAVTEENLDNVNTEIATLTARVDAQITSEDIKLEISKELANGTNKVTTTTGFTFDENGLTVEKTNSEMKTQITEDGMQVYKNDTEVLTADHSGVKALNLRASTYLIIGDKSRFENYGTSRTGCFWIGG